MAFTQPPAWCEHGPGQHDGQVPSQATAPEASRAWLLIEFDGLWAEAAVSTPLPGDLGKLAIAADELGIRVQLIRRPSRPATAPSVENASSGAGVTSVPSVGNGDSATHGTSVASTTGETIAISDANGVSGQWGSGRVFAAWTAGPRPWLADVTSMTSMTSAADAAREGDAAPLAGPAAAASLDLAALAAGKHPSAGVPVERMYLVCAHGRRDRCCARFGAPLARALAEDCPDEVWETTHVGGHKFAANLVLLPHGLYYGPCDLPAARAAIAAYQRGSVLPRRYRGRAGHDAAAQQSEHAALIAAGELPASSLPSLTAATRAAIATATRTPTPFLSLTDSGASPAHNLLDHGLRKAEPPNVEIRLLRFEDGPHPGMSSLIDLFELANDEDPSIVYLEIDTAIQEVTRTSEVTAYKTIFTRIREAALGPAATRKHLEQLSA